MRPTPYSFHHSTNRNAVHTAIERVRIFNFIRCSRISQKWNRERPNSHQLEGLNLETWKKQISISFLRCDSSWNERVKVQVELITFPIRFYALNIFVFQRFPTNEWLYYICLWLCFFHLHPDHLLPFVPLPACWWIYLHGACMPRMW